MNPAPAVTLTADPQSGPLHTRRRIRVDGAPPGSIVTVRALTRRGGTDWHARVSYLADESGSVDLDTTAPVSGDFRTADAMGLFWAQTPVTEPAPHPGNEDVRTPLRTEITAWVEPGTGYLDLPGDPTGAGPDGGGRTAHLTIIQVLLDDDVERRRIDPDADASRGLVGTIFRPAGTGPFPTVIVLNGSGGGINELRAAQFASKGIQAVALGYFRAGDLPRYISRTPLEYLERGIDFVTGELAPAGGRPWVSGQSRGGEATLLLAATYPDKIAGIVPVVPGAFVHGAQGAADPAEGWSGPTWTLRGQPLEHLWHNNTGVTWYPWDGAPAPDRHADVFMDALTDRELARAARIPIENFPGPVATVSGLDDRAWPSSMASRMVMDTLRRHGHGGARLLLDYEAAGHSIGVPFLPATRIEVTHPVSGTTFSNGGTPAGNAWACEDSHTRICDFIHLHTEPSQEGVVR